MSELPPISPAESQPRHWISWLAAAAVISTVLAVLLLLGPAQRLRTVVDQELVSRANDALREQQPELAIPLLDELLRRHPDSAEALTMAGRAYATAGRFDEAVTLLRQIADSERRSAASAAINIGDILLNKLGKPSEAEESFRRAVRLNPASLDANLRMAFLLGLSGRPWEAIPYRLPLIRLTKADSLNLYLLCTGATVIENPEQLAELSRLAQGDPLLLLGLARQAIDQQQIDRALELLQEYVVAFPEHAAGQARLGQLLLEKKNDEAFVRWHEQLPESADQHPGIWVVRGSWSQEHGQPQSAMRCFWEAIRIDPNHERANYQLGQLLLAENRATEANIFLQRSKQLEALFDEVSTAWSSHDYGAARRASELCEQLGLVWESYGWARLVAEDAPDQRWAHETMKRLQPRIDSLPLERAIPESHPTQTVDLSDLPLPVVSVGSDGGTKQPDNRSLSFRLLKGGSLPEIRFVDEAATAGLVFEYFDGAPRDRQTRRMYEFNGGGVAVLDFDNDGWPDVYLTQGCRWPPGSQPQEYSDRLFRNQGDGVFVDVTAQSGLVDEQFSAGVTVGDFDNDGWLDLYVANIGGNRFLKNNGDGTFSDVTDETGTAGNDWSTSCLLADLNGDALPDLYVVNYLSEDDVFERLCPDSSGTVRSCSPRNFAAAQDRLYVNSGDGQFADVTSVARIEVPDGKGLGIVAADLTGSGRLSLFIANDAVPNFFFVNETAETGSTPHFSELGLISGLAMNADGRAEACMGVAAADFNGDGRCDLFVTNFYNESNTLYEQLADGVFRDATRDAGLYDASLKMLGFGTQSIDGDLDGAADLIVTNGHIDDLSDAGTPYQMPAQFFRGDGIGHFSELPAEQLGPYFSRKQLGRGLARLDWNRDGREDVVVSHLDAPAALLTNRTTVAGHFVALQLRGVKSSRDAIGSVVTVRSGAKTWTKQLTAGDGFQCSNERRLVVGLGATETVDELTIRWPSGLVKSFDNLVVDRDFLAIEGAESLVRLKLSEDSGSP